MPNVRLDVEERQRFLEGVAFSAGAMDEFLTVLAERSRLTGAKADPEWADLVLTEYNRSLVDIVGLCIERAQVMQPRINEWGSEAILGDDLFIPWLLILEMAVHALGHQEGRLTGRESAALRAGRLLFAGMEDVAVDVRERSGIELVCPECNPGTRFDKDIWRDFDFDIDVS